MARSHIYFPPPPPFMGAAQAYAPRKLAPELLSVSADAPPIRGPGRDPSRLEWITAAQPNPWVYVFFGGRQTHTLRELPPSVVAVPEDNPPFGHLGRLADTIAIIRLWQPPAWPGTWTGGNEPYGQNRAPASVTGLPADEPPFSNEGRAPTLAEIIALTQPNPWTYAYQGTRQVYEPRKLAPQLTDVRVDDPPFAFEGKTAQALAIVMAMQPNPWTYNFMGGWQVFTPRKLSPGHPGFSLDQPPFGLGGKDSTTQSIIEQWQPNPWTYSFYKSGQPFEPRKLNPDIIAVPADNPPFGQAGRKAVAAEIVALTQPNPWTYTFLGRRQPFERRKINPAIIDVRDDDPPFTRFSRRPGYFPIIKSWERPPPNYAQKSLYDRSHQVQFRSVTAWGFILTWGASERQVNYPPVSFGGPIATKMETVWVHHQNRWRYVYGSSRQPYGRKK